MDSATKAHEEADEASLLALEKQGISILSEESSPASDEHRDNFVEELMNNSGIEIVSSVDNEEEF